MLKSYILIAWRNFLKHRTFTLINLGGFALAMASCFLIIFHIQSELSYERGFPKHKDIYRVHVSDWAKTSPPMAEALADFYPEVISSARFYEMGSRVLKFEDYQVEVNTGYMADSTAIEMFDYNFISGDPKTSLRVPYTLVLTESLARKFFRDQDPVGKIMQINGRRDYTVTGVISDLPEATHFNFEYLISYSTFYKAIPENWTSAKGWMAPWTYLQIKSDDVPKMLSRMPDFAVKFYEGFDTPENLRTNYLLEVQALTDIHLQSHLEQEMGENSNAGYLYIFAAVAVFIIVIAAVNFINLNISLAFRRMKETGMRKVMGAVRSQLVKQYMAETIIMSFVAFLLAITLFFAVLPNYNTLAGRAVEPLDIFTPSGLTIMIGLILVVGILSGLYPALFISRFQPIDSLKSQKAPASGTSLVRKGLVVFQFAVSIFMIACTIVIYRQMQFFQTSELGFDKEQVVIVNMHGELGDQFEKNPDIVKAALQRNSDVIQVGATSQLPGEMISVEDLVPESADQNARFPNFRVLRADDGYINTLSLQIVEGRNFSPAFNDSASFIVNETAVKVLGLSQPIGTRVRNGVSGITGPIIGVLRDFHLTSLHNAIEPLAIQYDPGATDALLIKVRSEHLDETVRGIEASLKSIVPSTLVNYSFLDEKWNVQYREENKMNVLFNTFSIFMIVISCIGLFGLSAITMETRRKEIGIRKIVGASTRTIMGSLSKEYILMVLAGAAIGLPFTWWAMDAWLAGFAFKIGITVDVFFMALTLATVVAASSVVYNAIKTARANPVDALRSE